MSCNKFVFAAAAAAMTVASLAHAVVPTSAQVKQAPVSAPVVASAAVAAPVPVVSESHLLLGQINEAAREKVLKSLRDTGQSAAANQAPATVFAQVPAPAINRIPPLPGTLAPADARTVPMRPRTGSHDDGVSIVGTTVDGQSSRVLYSYNSGIYSAAVGQKMLNGVTAKSIHGLNVTVTDGKRSWDVPVAAASDMGSRN